MSVDQIIASIPQASREKRKQMRLNVLEKLEMNNTEWTAQAGLVLAALDAQEQAEYADLLTEIADLAPAERVLKAFTAEPMTETEEKLIRVLLDNPNSTSGELTEKLGWKAQSWHLHFGLMCANRGVYLGPPPAASLPNGKFYSGILADFDGDRSRFKMKPDVEAAFERLGLRKRG